ncbi:MAG TPA: heme ABC transporter permease [Stellaceae bacterium]|jgi:heme exporter protein C|nr:heme ABC transporter permease [Stellaceae bacterium]
MLSRFANPARFMRLSGAVLPFLADSTTIVLAVGLYLALAVAPPDYQQGESVRIMFVHVPAAWMALLVYLVMAVASLVALVWRHPLAEIAAQAAAPLGAAFTLVCLVTGSLWGRPMWGTWWAWDARMTSVLVLFFLYLGYIALVNAFDDMSRGARAGSVLALVGVVNLPIIKFSVDWWNTLHQAESVFRAGGPTIDSSMLWPLLVMALGYLLLFKTLLLVRMRTALNERKARALLLAAPRRRAAPPPQATPVLR